MDFNTVISKRKKNGEYLCYCREIIMDYKSLLEDTEFILKIKEHRWTFIT